MKIQYSSENNKSWHIDDIVKDITSKSICITGVARSGTTILGTIISSMQNVEYGFEPPMLGSLFHRMEIIPIAIWDKIYSEYLFEELLLGSLSGRKLNFNNLDWSCVFNSKTVSEIKTRFERSFRREDLNEIVGKYKIAYKIPDITHRLKVLVSRFPNTKVVIMLRNPDEVAASMIHRKWYNDKNILNLLGDNLIKVNGRLIPASMVEISEREWFAISEEERCHACYVCNYHSIVDSVFPVIDYAKLIENPWETISSLSQAFGLEWGELTPGLVQGISAKVHAPFKISDDGPWRKRALNLYDKLRHKSL